MDAMTPRQRMLAALASQPVDRPPVWMMRQAGRYLPEYRAVRTGRSFLEMVRTPELACEVTLQPIDRYGFDAAILFSDILTIPEAMGLDVTFPGGGPQIAPVVRSAADVDALRVPDIGVALDYVGEAMRLCRAGVGPDRALLGFAGAPWTLAAYMVEGAGSKSFPILRAMVWQQPEVLARLLDRLADAVIDLLLLQVEAGADAVQVFDTWAGELHAEDYRRVALPSTVRIVEAMRSRGVPVVLFARHPGHLTDATLEAGPDAIGMDWRVDVAETVTKAAAKGVAVQGNLDPAELFAPHDVITRRVREIHAAVGGRTGHVFNLGHGVWPQAPLDGVGAFVAAVQGLAE